MNITPEQAASIFLQLIESKTEIDPAELDREAITEHFRTVFARKTKEQSD